MPCIFEIQTMEVTEHPIYFTLSHSFTCNLSPSKYPDSGATAHLIILLCSIASFVSVFRAAYQWTTSRTAFLMKLQSLSLEFATKILYAFLLPLMYIHAPPPPILIPLSIIILPILHWKYKLWNSFLCSFLCAGATFSLWTQGQYFINK